MTARMKAALPGQLRAFRMAVRACAFFLLCAGSVPAASGDTLDPLRAEFEIIADNSSAWSDVRVRLDLRIHSAGQGKLAGNKFIGLEALDAVSVTDGQGRPLPHTVKEFPRKRILWEYGPAGADGTRHATLRFTMRKAVKRADNGLALEIDWVGGWTRPVLNARVGFLLPAVLSKQDVLSCQPEGYVLQNIDGKTRLQYEFPRLEKATFRLALKPPARAAVAAKPRAAAPEQASAEPCPPARPKPRITAVRCSQRDADSDRLVFELSQKTPYGVTRKPSHKQIIVSWKVPLDVGRDITGRVVRGALISGLEWNATPDGQLECGINLKREQFEMSAATLENPPRIYLDIAPLKQAPAEAAAPPGQEAAAAAAGPGPEQPSAPAPPAPAAATPEASPAGRPAELPADQATARQAQQPGGTTSTILPESTPAAENPMTLPKPSSTTIATTSIVPLDLEEKPVPIEEKIEYRKAHKLLKTGEYLHAVDAYGHFLEKYPETLLKEEVMYEIGDCYYAQAASDPQYYYPAIEAYLKARAAFPESAQSPLAAFRIGEAQRQRRLFVEARAQYQHVVQKYPQCPYVPDARYWSCECLYQMQKYRAALNEFQQFITDFSGGPREREATLRVADCYVQLKDFDRAEFYYQKAMKRWPDLLSVPLDSLNNMGMAYYDMGRFARCRDVLLYSFNVYPEQENRGELLRFVGDAYQWEGDMQRALLSYGHLVSMFGGSKQGMLGMMRMADLRANVAGMDSAMFTFSNFDPYQRPEDAYRWVIQNDPAGDLLTEAHYKLGFTMAQAGKYFEALDSFKRSMARESSGVYYRKSFENVQKILVKMIKIAADQHDYVTAVELYQKHAKNFLESLQDCSFRYVVGKSHFELGFLSSAERFFSELMRRNDDVACKQRSIVGMCAIDLQKGNVEQAEETLSLLLYGQKVEPGVDAEAYHVLGDAYHLNGKSREAVDAYAVPLASRDISMRAVRSLYRSGEAFAKIGYHYNGIRVLKRLMDTAAQVQPQTEELHYLVRQARMMTGDLLLASGNYQAAVKAYRAMADASPGPQQRGWALLKMGEALAKTGDESGAARALEEAAAAAQFHFPGTLAQARLADLTWTSKMQNELKNYL